ncbi:hypothetical protein SAMN04487777_13226 [Priestia aryabhattai B8W22]|nr:hypothetical protein SAMN04487777_13226 [Priestia aryabhattai B8W22]
MVVYLRRKEEVEKFIKEVHQLEKKFNVKIVADDPDQEIIYLDEQERKLYYIQDGNVLEW